MIDDEKLITENPTSRRLFLKTAFLLGIPAVSRPFFSLFVPKLDRTVTSYTRVFGHPNMKKEEFNSIKNLWIDGDRFANAVRAYQRKGLILSFKQVGGANGTSVEFVFASKDAKQSFDDYLVKNKIFKEQQLLALGLVHETGIT